MNERVCLPFMIDFSAIYLPPELIKDLLSASQFNKRGDNSLRINLINFINKFSHYSAIDDIEYDASIEDKFDKIREGEKSYIPANIKEMRKSKYYFSESTLNKFSILSSDAEPIAMTNCNGEAIYLKSNERRLHTKRGWESFNRQVRKNEEPTKIIHGLCNDPNKSSQLYGLWQTAILVFEPGVLPKNQYGNFEMVNSKIIPQGIKYLNMQYIEKICKNTQVEYVPVIGRFDKHKGKTFAVKEGVLIHEKDNDMVLQKYQEMIEKIKKQEEEKTQKEIKYLWKILFMKILNKRHASQLFEKFQS